MHVDRHDCIKNILKRVLPVIQFSLIDRAERHFSNDRCANEQTWIRETFEMKFSIAKTQFGRLGFVKIWRHGLKKYKYILMYSKKLKS